MEQIHLSCVKQSVGFWEETVEQLCGHYLALNYLNAASLIVSASIRNHTYPFGSPSDLVRDKHSTAACYF